MKTLLLVSLLFATVSSAQYVDTMNPVLAKGASLKLSDGRVFENWQIQRHTSATVFITTASGSVEVDRSLLPQPVAARFPINDSANISGIGVSPGRPTQSKNGMVINGAAHDPAGGILISVTNRNTGSQTFDYRGLVATALGGELFEVGDCRPHVVLASKSDARSSYNTDPTLTIPAGQTRLMILTFTASRSWESLTWKDQSDKQPVMVAVVPSIRAGRVPNSVPATKKK